MEGLATSLGGSKAKPWKLPHCLGSKPALPQHCFESGRPPGSHLETCSADCVTLDWATVGSDPSLAIAVPPGPWGKALYSEFPGAAVLGHLTSQPGLKCPTSG